jgi:hypothetical protein
MLLGKFKQYRQVHLMIVGVLLRITGYVFVFGGIIFLVWSLRLLANPQATLNIDGVPSTDIDQKKKMAAFALEIVGVGALLICAPYLKKRIVALFRSDS